MSKHPSLKRISVVGHSMGGLLLRYAIGGELWPTCILPYCYIRILPGEPPKPWRLLLPQPSGMRSLMPCLCTAACFALSAL